MATELKLLEVSHFLDHMCTKGIRRPMSIDTVLLRLPYRSSIVG